MLFQQLSFLCLVGNYLKLRVQQYQAKVLGKGTVKVGVEAALRFGWDKYLGSDGGFVGMTGFGASAPAPALYEHFGITAANVVAEAKARL